MANLSINPEKAFFIIVKHREFDAKDAPADPDSGSNSSDDGEVDILEDQPDDSTYEELAGAIRGLNIDEQLDLLALMWVGRGDFTPEEWKEARKEAGSVGHRHITRYLVHTPMAGDYIEDAMAALGYSFEEEEKNRL